MTKKRKWAYSIVTAVVVILAIVFYVRFYYVFGVGVKTGELNFVVKKGYIFKTYEGKMIQTGLRAAQPGAMQSYEFEFSIQDTKIADSLMKMKGGKEVALHYKEYLGTLPWRGYSKYIVDSIVSIRDTYRVSPEIQIGK